MTYFPQYSAPNVLAYLHDNHFRQVRVCTCKVIILGHLHC